MYRFAIRVFIMFVYIASKSDDMNCRVSALNPLALNPLATSVSRVFLGVLYCVGCLRL